MHNDLHFPKEGNSMVAVLDKLLISNLWTAN